MIRIDDPHSIKLIAQACNVQFVPTFHHCIAEYDSNDRLKGGSLFTDYWGGAVAMHVAGFRKSWGSKTIIWLSFQYPFVQLRVKKIIGLVPEWNIISRNNALRIGFKIEHKVDDVFNHQHLDNGMYIMSMRKEDCRWLDMKPPMIELASPERTNKIEAEFVPDQVMTLH